jgi:hypothetical protein
MYRKVELENARWVGDHINLNNLPVCNREQKHA